MRMWRFGATHERRPEGFICMLSAHASANSCSEAGSLYVHGAEARLAVSPGSLDGQVVERSCGAAFSEDSLLLRPRDPPCEGRRDY